MQSPVYTGRYKYCLCIFTYSQPASGRSAIIKQTAYDLFELFRLIKTKKFHLLNTSFTKFQLPVPGRAQSIFQSFHSFPSQFGISEIRICPNFFNISRTTSNDLVVQLHTGSFLEALINSNTETPRPVPILNTSTFSFCPFSKIRG